MDATFANRDIFYPLFDLSLDTALNDAPAAERRVVNSVAIENNEWRNWQWENVLSYNRRLADRHNLNLTLGTTALSLRSTTTCPCLVVNQPPY